MQLKFPKTTLRCLGTACQDVRSVEVTQELRLPDGMPDIGRVLTTWGQVMIRSKEWQGDMIAVSGGVMVWALYAPEDGTEPRSVECWIPFQIKWELDRNDREGPIRVMPLLRFSDARSLSSRKMMVRAGVSAAIQALYPMDVEFFAAETVPEDVQLLKNTYPIRVPVESGERTFMMDEELNLPDSSSRGERMLGIMAVPEVSEKKVLSDRIVFKGVLNLHLAYRDSEGRVHSLNQGLPFSQLTELDRSHSSDARADLAMAVTSFEADFSEPGKLRLKCGLVGQYLVDDRHTLEVVQDAYSPFRPVIPEMAKLELPVILEDRTDNLTAEQTLQGQLGRSVDSVFLPDFPKFRQTGEGIQMELPGVFQTLVYDENDALQGMTGRWEGKLNLPADEQSKIFAMPKSSDAQSMTSGDGLVLTAPMSVTVRTESRDGIPMVSGLDLGEMQEPDPGRPSIILCRGNGEQLWEIAKKHGSTVAAIEHANSGTAGDGMLLIPVL